MESKESNEKDFCFENIDNYDTKENIFTSFVEDLEKNEKIDFEIFKDVDVENKKQKKYNMHSTEFKESCIEMVFLIFC